MSVYIENNNHNNVSQYLPTCDASSGCFIRKAVAKVKFWVSRSQQRKQLAHLDERMLMDIGVTADQLKAEIAKPFWK